MARKILILLLILHTIVSYFVFETNGYWSVFPPYNEFYVNQIFSDLVVSLTLVHLFIYLELRKQARSTKWVALSMVGAFFLGSFAPLIYLLVDKDLLRA
jgi:hypothetical protein